MKPGRPGRYVMKGWLSFTVAEGETPEQVLAEIEASFDSGIGDAIGHDAYWSPDDIEGPTREDD